MENRYNSTMDIVEKLSSLTLPWPVDWGTLFNNPGQPRPLILEIGFGRGAFLLHLARSNPAAQVVGLEISSHCLDAAERAIVRLRLANLRVIHSTAEAALHHLFEPASIQQIHINFPDPWFKTRHRHRRLMQRDTVDAMVNRLAPGGDLFLATDIIEYAEMSAALLAETPGLENQLATPWGDSLPGRVVTKYEATARREGRECYYFAYRRNDQSAPDVPVMRELEMSHLIFHSPLTLDGFHARFAPEEERRGETIVHLMAVYQGAETLLYEVFVKEPAIDQHFALILTPRPQTPGDFILKLSTLGRPRVTAGVHRAVAMLGERLIAMHPEGRALSDTLKMDESRNYGSD